MPNPPNAAAAAPSAYVRLWRAADSQLMHAGHSGGCCWCACGLRAQRRVQCACIAVACDTAGVRGGRCSSSACKAAQDAAAELAPKGGNEKEKPPELAAAPKAGVEAAGLAPKAGVDAPNSPVLGAAPNSPVLACTQGHPWAPGCAAGCNSWCCTHLGSAGLPKGEGHASQDACEVTCSLQQRWVVLDHRHSHRATLPYCQSEQSPKRSQGVHTGS